MTLFATLVYGLSFTKSVVLYCVHFYVFLVLFYFITVTLKCFALAVKAISAEIRAILQNETCKILQFLCHFVNSTHDSQFHKHCPIMRKLLCAQSHRIILTSLTKKHSVPSASLPKANSAEITDKLHKDDTIQKSSSVFNTSDLSQP